MRQRSGAARRWRQVSGLAVDVAICVVRGSNGVVEVGATGAAAAEAEMAETRLRRVRRRGWRRLGMGAHWRAVQSASSCYRLPPLALVWASPTESRRRWSCCAKASESGVDAVDAGAGSGSARERPRVEADEKLQGQAGQDKASNKEQLKIIKHPLTSHHHPSRPSPKGRLRMRSMEVSGQNGMGKLV